jgi:hypothetical protein
MTIYRRGRDTFCKSMIEKKRMKNFDDEMGRVETHRNRPQTKKIFSY